MADVVAKLALEDGTVFTGRGFGAQGERFGETVFNTSMTGYQEVLTDPSYRGQIVTMTYPLIGNYGVTPEDAESQKPQVEGFVVREAARMPSNFRSQLSLDAYLRQHNVIGLGMAAMCENFCNRDFARVVGDTFISPADRCQFLLPRYPIETVSAG